MLGFLCANWKKRNRFLSPSLQGPGGRQVPLISCFNCSGSNTTLAGSASLAGRYSRTSRTKKYVIGSGGSCLKPVELRVTSRFAD